ncbi:MAG TPA: DUF1700 domain-containing protein [Burkholderiaceae bacterium]
MTRFEYIAALRSALEGLPPEVVERTVAEYEKRIHEASAAGRNEDEIIAGLGDPQQVAEDLRAQHAPKTPAAVAPPPQAHTVPPSQRPGSAVRMFFSFVGLMVFNLFLVIPAIAYAGLLIAAFAVSFACYLGGIAVTGASVAGVNQLSLDEPFHHVYLDKPGAIDDMRHHDGRTVVNIGERGVHVETGDKRIHVVPASAVTTETGSASTPAAAPAPESDHNTSVDIGPKGIVVKDEGSKDDEAETNDDEDMDVDMPGLHIHNRDVDAGHNTVMLGTDFISSSQPVQVGVGIGIIFAGIIGFLLCLTIARYTWLGVVRLAQMEFSVLRGA